MKELSQPNYSDFLLPDVFYLTIPNSNLTSPPASLHCQSHNPLWKPATQFSWTMNRNTCSVNMQVKGKKITEELLTRKTKIHQGHGLKWLPTGYFWLIYEKKKQHVSVVGPFFSKIFSVFYFLTFQHLTNTEKSEAEQKEVLSKASKQESHLSFGHLSSTVKSQAIS